MPCMPVYAASKSVLGIWSACFRCSVPGGMPTRGYLPVYHHPTATRPNASAPNGAVRHRASPAHLVAHPDLRGTGARLRPADAGARPPRRPTTGHHYAGRTPGARQLPAPALSGKRSQPHDPHRRPPAEPVARKREASSLEGGPAVGAIAGGVRRPGRPRGAVPDYQPSEGHPFEVAIPEGLEVSGVILADRLKSLDLAAAQGYGDCPTAERDGGRGHAEGQGPPRRVGTRRVVVAGPSRCEVESVRDSALG